MLSFGVLMEIAATDPQARSNIAALQRGLRQLGWLEGNNLAIDYRWAPDDPVLVWKFAKELVELRPDENQPGFWLHVEKVETHSPDSLDDRNQEFCRMADAYHVNYDGMDVGPALS